MRVSRLWLVPGLPAFALLAGFALFLGQSRARPEQPLRRTDGIAVLTGGPERVETGLRLLAEGHGAWLIVSGVSRSADLADLARTSNVPPDILPPETPQDEAPQDEAPQNGMPQAGIPQAGAPGSAAPSAGPAAPGPPSATARPLAAWPGSAPVAPRPAITLGRIATSTYGNGQEIGAWARAHGIASLRVVTAGYHMPRSLLELRRNLPEVALVPHPVQAAGPRPGLLLREYSKLIGAMLGFSALKPDAPPR